MKVNPWISFPYYIHLLMLANVLTRIAILSTAPFFPLAFSHNAWLANMLLSGFLLGDLVGGLLVGYLADKYRQSLIATVFALGLALIGSIFLLLTPPNSWLISVFSFLMGSGIYGINTMITSYIAQGTNEGMKKTVFQYQFWTGNVASLFGVALGWIALDLRKAELLFIYSCPAVVFTCLILFFVRRKESFLGSKVTTSRVNLKSFLRLLTPYLLTVLVIKFILSICHQQLRTTLPLFIKDYSVNSNEIYSYSLIVSILISISLQRLVDRTTEVKSWIRTILLFCLPLGMFLMTLQGIVPLLVATVLYTLGEMVVFPLTQYLSEKKFPLESKTVSFGFLNLSRIGFVVGGPIGIVVREHSSCTAVFFLSATLLFIISVVVEILLRGDKTETQVPTVIDAH